MSNITYTAWDGAGRPTAGRDVGSGFDNTHAITYNDTARTRTTVVNGGVVTTVETYDANGNQIATTATGGNTFSNSTTTITATTQVCK